MASLKTISAEQGRSQPVQLEICRQLEFLWQLAREAKLEIDRDRLDARSEPFEDAAGLKHVVVLVREYGKVLKRTVGLLGFECFGTEALPFSYLLNLALNAAIFGIETRFEGIVKRSDGTSEIVTSQNYQNAADPTKPHPSRAEIDQFLKTEGFYEVGSSKSVSYRYVNREIGLAIDDARQRNFILTANGPVPFDLHIETLNDQAFADVVELLEESYSC